MKRIFQLNLEMCQCHQLGDEYDYYIWALKIVELDIKIEEYTFDINNNQLN